MWLFGDCLVLLISDQSLHATCHSLCGMSGGDELGGHAFLSYVREDAARVDQLEGALAAAGVRVWRDTADIWPGEDWEAIIRGAITGNALAFIACFSRHGLARKVSYQNLELRLAIDQLRLHRLGDPWFFPVRLDDCIIPDVDIGGGRTLSSIQHVDLFGTHADENMARLVESVLRLLGQHRSDTIAPEERWQTSGNRADDDAARSDLARNSSSPQANFLHQQAVSHVLQLPFLGQ